MTTALDLLDVQAGRVQPLFITVDPARDTTDVLADYMRHFHPNLLGLTGSEAQVRAVARAYKVHRRKVILPDAAGPDDYLVDHGSNLYLMGPDGGFLTLFHFRATSAEDMAAIIRKYLAEAAG
jgi:protein SCO1/2